MNKSKKNLNSSYFSNCSFIIAVKKKGGLYAGKNIERILRQK